MFNRLNISTKKIDHFKNKILQNIIFHKSTERLAALLEIFTNGPI